MPRVIRGGDVHFIVNDNSRKKKIEEEIEEIKKRSKKEKERKEE